MNVFEVVELEERTIAGLPGWTLTRQGRRWVATDPEGAVRASGRIPGNVEGQARDYATRAARSTPAADTDTPRTSPSDNGRREPTLSRDSSDTSRTRPDGRIEPTLSRDRSPSPDAAPNRELRADPHPDTPTTNSLTASERRRLARTGSVTRRGRTFTRSDIARMDAETARLRGGPTIPGETRPDAPQARPTDPETPKNPPKVPGNSILGRIGRWLTRIFGSQLANAIQTAINLSSLEDTLDAYWRAIADYSDTLDQNGKRQLSQQLRADSIQGLPQPLVSAYVDVVERVTETIVEGIVGAIMGVIGFAGAAQLLAAIGVSTGGIGLVAAILAGGAVAFFGTQIIYNILDEVGVNDWIEREIGSNFFTPGMITGMSLAADGMQEWLGGLLDIADDAWLTGWAVPSGDLVRDSIEYLEADEEEETAEIDNAAAEENLKRLIKSDPKLMQAYRAGKEEAKEIIREL